jgi:hypothetical protein
VLLGHRGEELLREKTDLRADRYRSAFATHRYSWCDSDPYAEGLRRYLEGDPELPPNAAPILAERAAAVRLKKKDEAARLKAQLADLGVVARDDGRRQLWRPIPPA